MGMSTDNSIREEEEEGVALNSTTGMEERENLSHQDGAQGEVVGFDKGGTKLKLGRPLNKEEGGPTCPFPSFNNSHALSVFGRGWIFDCGATDTMSYDPIDFLTRYKPIKNIIKTANGEGIKVKGVGAISFTNNLTLKIIVLELSHKLLSVSQLTRDLDCTVLMKPDCCIVQDA